MMHTTLFDLLDETAAARPDAVATTYRDRSMTYAELRARVLAAAAGLVRLGGTRGERVAIFLEKRHETVLAIFGASAAGMAFVPVNPALRPRQVAHVVRDSGASVLVTSGERWRSLAPVLGEASPLRTLVLVDGGAGDGPGPGRVTWEDLLGDATDDPPVRSIDMDLGAILYTSGSTGGPKGVALTHRNLIVGAQSVNAYLENGPDDVILSVLPLSFDAGLSQVTTGVAAGSHVVLMNYLFPRDVVRLCEEHSVTAMTCVPPLWRQVAGQDWSVAGRNLRYFASTGGRMPRPTLETLRAVFPQARPYLMYGLTEAFRSTYLDPAQVDDRPDSIGRAIPNAEILVVGPDGAPCAPGEVGELVHRGALVALGYWNDPVRTAERFRPLPGDGTDWRVPETAVWSGDLVRADEDGYLYFVGRTDEMIKSSGYRMSPSEIEEVAYSTGLVGDAVALGVPDEDLGQVVLLVVTSRAEDAVDEGALLRAMRTEMPRYMVPSRVVVLDEMPRSPNGKLDRAALAKEYAA